MKKLLFLIILGVLAFYAAWPAYSLYQIVDGVRAPDEAKLQQKIAWGPLRQSLHAPVTERVKQEIGNQSKGRGLEGALAGELGKNVAPQLVEQILDAYVTPKGIITLAANGGNIDMSKLGIGNLVQKFGDNSNPGETSGGIGDLLEAAKELVSSIPGGKEFVATTLSEYSKDLSKIITDESEEATEKDGKAIIYGPDNIKSFEFTGPTSFEVGIAKSPTAKKADLIAGMRFIDNDWKLDKIVPSFK